MRQPGEIRFGCRLLKLLVALLFVPSASAEDPLFFVDSPSLILLAAEAIYRKYPDISKGGLVAREYSVINLYCHPGQGRLTTDPPPLRKYVRSPCKVTVEFVIRDSIKRDIAALANGYCEYHTEYQSISVHVYEDDAMELERNGFTSQSSSSGPCATAEPAKYYNPDELITRHKKALQNEIEHLPTTSKPSGTREKQR